MAVPARAGRPTEVLADHVVDDVGVAQESGGAGLDQHVARTLQRDRQVELADLRGWSR
jgi:hypothetical protein